MTTQQRIYLTAKNIGENKCNLFVYEVLLAAGVDIGTPNQLEAWKQPILELANQLSRPPWTIDWFNGKVSIMKLVGEANKDQNLAYSIDWEQGDILTDGVHMAIVSENGKTIGAGEKTVNETKFGFDFIYSDSVKIFRYN